ncbi:MAG TPA: serpin family protein [Bacteroides sp.]|nr:serpin family protein [Bacteroides sp.]
MQTMKNIRVTVIILLSALVFFPACEESDPPEKEPNQVVLRKKSAELIQADREFTFELFREVLALSDEENIMVSPLSVSYALGMTFNGAAGATRDAFCDVLHFGELSNQEVNESYQDLMDQLVRLDKQVKFSIANSIWYRLGFQVLDAFITANQTYFDAMVSELDFSDPQAVETINDWIEEKTNGKIRDMLDYIPGDAVMYLVNAIYFNAKWKYEFDPESTQEGTFYREDGTTGRAAFMKVDGAFSYTENDDFSAVELPYGDSAFSMVVVLPAPGKDAGDLVAGMDLKQWDSRFETSFVQNIQVELPKFKYGFKKLLNEPLVNLGLGVAFSGGADFSGITPGGGIYISRVIHQTFIDVQEEGTEAAAATIVEMRETSMPQPAVFRADRPFLYLIKENSTGAILFIGKVGMPEYADS